MRSIAGWPQPLHLTAPPTDWVISPLDYGADPTGRTDSTAAFQAAVAALLARNSSGHRDEGGTFDLGGALLDLQGGDYLTTQPLVFPANYSNYRVAHGTLRAVPGNFPADRYLIEVGGPLSAAQYCNNWGDSCVEDASFEDLLIDGGATAAGCMQFVAVIGVNAGPDIFCVNFTTNGVDIEAGHEVFMHHSWIGSCWYTPPSQCWLNASALGNTTGVLINGNDHALDTVVVFAGLTGVAVNGAANVFTSVHTWNTQVGSVPNAVGIIDTVWQNRYVGPYLDYVDFVCRGCAVTTLVNGFFLGGARLLLKPHPDAYPVRGLYIAGNQWAGSGDGQADVLALPPAPGVPYYAGVEDVTVTGSMSDNPSQSKRSTVASVTVNGTSPWTVDFSGRLMFDATQPTTAIRTVAYSYTSLDGVFCRHHALPANGSVVTVVSDVPTARAVVTITVDQSVRTAA